jgi:hypothetical protein
MEASLDDPGIPGSELLFRRISRSGDTSMIITDEVSGDRTISSGAFVMDDDGCSVYLASILSSSNLGPEDLAVAPQNVVISLTAKTVRAAGLGVRLDPWPPEGGTHPRNAAHGLITNVHGLGSKKARSARRSLAAAAVFVVG